MGLSPAIRRRWTSFSTNARDPEPNVFPCRPLRRRRTGQAVVRSLKVFFFFFFFFYEKR